MSSTRLPISKPFICREDIEAVEKVLRSGMLSQGPKVEEFEENFAEYIGTEYAVAVNSGTAALHVALLSYGIKEGNEVITTPFTFIATANSILFVGAKPVFADIEENSFNIDPDSIAEKITKKTKVIIPVHLYGQPANMKAITEIASDNNLIVIEDACQAHGAKFNGIEVGSFGTGCFSFYPTKNMTTGEGGMITTNDRKIAEKAGMIRAHGQKEKYIHEILGYNHRMTDIGAAIGICQLIKLDEFNNNRVKNAKILTEGIKKIKGLIPPYVKPNVKHVFHQYTVRVTEYSKINRDNLKQRLSKKGVGTGVYYPIPIHKQPLYKKLGYNNYLPNSEKAANEVISLPVHPSLTKEDLKRIVDVIKNV